MLQAEAPQLRKEKPSRDQKLEESCKEEESMPWNMATLSKNGFGKSMVNTKTEKAEDSEEVREEKHKAFLKSEKQIKHFGLLRQWRRNGAHGAGGPPDHLHAVHSGAGQEPKGGPPTSVTSDRQCTEDFNHELEAFKESLRYCANPRIRKATKEDKEEEREQQLGPGGLNWVEVPNSTSSEAKEEVGSGDPLLEAVPKPGDKKDVSPSRHNHHLPAGPYVPLFGQQKLTVRPAPGFLHFAAPPAPGACPVPAPVSWASSADPSFRFE
ncbi:Hsp90 co-chaperone Cdc37 [Tupaia chinensis]|uniref:Hsp90 co-chaperone Cdc37 n=1 Tax=Tupaia chinensis TaxID=246437 RepID=L9KPU6_TUPCH|nr:Hsp90 co-chaperone Cdc37 [Tupaia chinensis]